MASHIDRLIDKYEKIIESLISIKHIEKDLDKHIIGSQNAFTGLDQINKNFEKRLIKGSAHETDFFVR